MPQFREWRLRFGLRSVFLGVAVICIVLSTVLAFSRRGSEFEAWDATLRDQICRNMAKMPASVIHLDPVDSVPDFVDADPSIGFEGAQLDALNATGVHTLWSPTVTFDVRQALQNESPTTLARRLMAHYESGFVEKGLKRISLTPGAICPPVAEKSTIWVSSRLEWNTIVTLSVRVDANLGQAVVTLRHLARPSRGG